MLAGIQNPHNGSIQAFKQEERQQEKLHSRYLQTAHSCQLKDLWSTSFFGDETAASAGEPQGDESGWSQKWSVFIPY